MNEEDGEDGRPLVCSVAPKGLRRILLNRGREGALSATDKHVLFDSHRARCAVRPQQPAPHPKARRHDAIQLLVHPREDRRFLAGRGVRSGRQQARRLGPAARPAFAASVSPQAVALRCCAAGRDAQQREQQHAQHGEKGQPSWRQIGAELAAARPLPAGSRRPTLLWRWRRLLWLASWHARRGGRWWRRGRRRCGRWRARARWRRQRGRRRARARRRRGRRR